jgi:hypothetical protein
MSSPLSLLPEDQAMTLKWDIAPPEGKKLSTAYVIYINRENNDYNVRNLSLIEASKKCYCVTGLENGQKYMFQLVQLMDDGTQVSTLSYLGIPRAKPNAIELVDVAATTTSLSGSHFNVTVNITNPNAASGLIWFTLIQVHYDAPITEGDDYNEEGGVYALDDILSFSKPAGATTYVLENVPRHHYKIQALYEGTSSNMLDVFAYLNPSNVTVVATSGQANKLPFTVTAEDNPNALIETIRVTLYLNDKLKGTIDLTNGTGFSKDGTTITGSGEFTGLTNDTVYRVETVGITADEPVSIDDDTDNMVSSTVGTSTGVPHNPTNATATLSFTPSNGVATTSYTIALADSTKPNYFDIVYKDITEQEVYRASNMTANFSLIDAAYLFDGLKVYATIKDPILASLAQHWLTPQLQLFSGEYLYAHTEVVSERLNIETKPDPVSELQLFDHNKISFRAAWNPNTEPDYFTITSENLSDGEPIVSQRIYRDNTTSGSIFKSGFITFTEDTEYTLNVVATNATDSSTPKSITFWNMTSPPVLSSATLDQVGYDLLVSLLAVVPTTSYWNNGRAVADVYVNDELIHTGVSVDEPYYFLDLAYDDVVRVNFKHVAFYYKYESLATRHNTALADEYSQALTRTVTVTPHPATFTGLSWTQNSDKLGYGALTWSQDLATGATASYVYTLTTGGETSDSVPVSLGGIVAVQYKTTYTLELTSTVVYRGYTTTYSDSIEVEATMPELTPTITYTKIEPSTGIPGDKMVSYSFALDNNYTYVSAKVKYNGDATEYVVLAPPFNKFTMAVPSVKNLSFKIVGSLTNGDFPSVQKETEWIDEQYIWGLPPTIELVSAERISGGSKVTYNVSCNGDYVTGVVLIVVPLDITTTSIAFTNTTFNWTNLFDSALFTQEFPYDVFPNEVANKDDIKISMFALNNSGFGQFEQNYCPGAELPSSVTIIPSTYYDTDNHLISFSSTWRSELTRPDYFSCYMFRTSDNVMVLDQIVMNTPSSEGMFHLDIADVAELWTEYKIKVRAQNSAGVSAYESLTFTYGTPPPPVTELAAVTVLDEDTEVKSTTVSFVPTWTNLTAPDNFYVFVTGPTGVAYRNNISPNTITIGDLVTTPITGLVSGRSYTVAVHSQNRAGYSAATLPPFDYYSGSGAIADLNVINKTMSFTSYWSSEATKPDNVYFHVAAGGVDVDSGFLSIGATSGGLVTEQLDNLVSGTTYTLYAQPFKNDTPSAAPVSVIFDYVKGPNPVTVTSIRNNMLHFTSTWTDVKPDIFYWYIDEFYGEVLMSQSSGDTFSASFGSLLSGGTVNGTSYTMYIHARTYAGGRSDDVVYPFTYGALPPKVSTIQVSGNTVTFVANWTTTTPDWFSWYLDGSPIINKVLVGTNVSGSTFTFELSGMTVGNYTVNIQAETELGFNSGYESKSFNYGSVPDPVTAITLNSSTKMVSFTSPQWTALNKPSSFTWSIANSGGTTVAISSASGILVGSESPGSIFNFSFSTVTGGNYTAYITARNVVGGTTASDAIVFHTAPQTPTTVRFTSPNELSFYASWNVWDQPASFTYTINNSDGTTAYTKSLNNTLTSGQKFTVTLSDLTPGSTYTGTVSATNSYGTSGSVAIGDTTLTANPSFVYGSVPDPVTAITLNSSTKMVSFTSQWTAYNKPSSFTWSIANSGGTTVASSSALVGTESSGSIFNFAISFTTGGSYTVYITARNMAGGTLASNPVVFYAAPQNPTTVRFTNPNEVSFYSTWSEGDIPSSFTYTINNIDGTTTYTKSLDNTFTSGQKITVALTDLTSGSTYTGTVSSTNTYGTSDSVAIGDTTLTANPSFAVGITPDQVTGITLNSATSMVSFTVPTTTTTYNRATSFDWYITNSGTTVASASDVSLGAVSSGGTASFASALTTGGSYVIFITTKNTFGSSPTTAKSVVYYTNPLDPYTVLFANPTQLSFYADWNEGNIPTSFSYKIYKGGVLQTSMSKTIYPTITATGQQFTTTLTGLAYGTTYTGTVSATNTYGTSGSVTIPSFVGWAYPDQVTGITLNSATSMVSFTVPRTTTTYNRPTSFDWYITNSGTTVASASGVSLGTVSSGGTASFATVLPSGANYVIFITTKHLYGSSPTTSANVVFYNLPLAPYTALFTKPDQLTFYAKWTAFTYPKSFTYIITQLGTTASVSKTLINTSTLTTTTGLQFIVPITGLTPGTTYTGTVNAVNDTGVSSVVNILGNPISSTSFVYGAIPDPVTDITVDSTAKTFSFTAPSWTVYNKPSSFIWYIQTAGITVASSSTPILVTTQSSGSIFGPVSVATGGDYTFYVTSVNGIGSSTPFSKYLPFYSVPQDPYTIVFSSPGTFTFYAKWTKWDIPTSFSYGIYSGSNLIYTNVINNSGAPTTSMGQKYTFAVTSLTVGTSYTCRINALNTYGNSSIVTTTFTYGNIPNAPTNIVVKRTTATSTSVVLYFKHTYTTLNPPSEFDITQYNSDNGWRTRTISVIKDSGSTYSTQFDGLNPTLSYWYGITARNGVGGKRAESASFLLNNNTLPVV